MTMLNALKGNYNISHTENGGITHKSTLNSVLDLFAMGAAYRKRTDEDCVLLFKKAYDMSPKYALKCLFYIRDVRGGGQGERRFFRVCMNWLAQYDPIAVKRNMKYFAEYGRWDDLYCLADTCLEGEAFEILKNQLLLDMTCETPSLCAKWVKSENTSSRETRRLASKTREALEMDHKHYRKMLSYLRTKINLLEKLMSENRWDEIQFDKIPSKAGLKYKNVFAKKDIIKEKYARFAKDTTTKVNAATLYPYEVVEKAINATRYYGVSSTDRAMINKYWDNLTDYFNGATFNALAMVDTSGSMMGTPMNVAISLGLYCAERMKGPFHNHYISFSSRPQLIECEGYDFVDKVKRIYSTNLCENTNIEAAFDMLLHTAVRNRVPQSEMPQNIIVISDMEFDAATGNNMVGWGWNRTHNTSSLTSANAETVMEGIARKWKQYGYECPYIVYWNVNARNDNIPALGVGRISFVSGFSPSIFSTIMSGKDGIDLMLDKLDSQRYAPIK